MLGVGEIWDGVLDWAIALTNMPTRSAVLTSKEQTWMTSLFRTK